MSNVIEALIITRMIGELVALALRLGIPADELDAAIAQAKAEAEKLNDAWTQRLGKP